MSTQSFHVLPCTLSLTLTDTLNNGQPSLRYPLQYQSKLDLSMFQMHHLVTMLNTFTQHDMLVAMSLNLVELGGITI